MTLILSQWKADGGYRYYEAAGYSAPIGDDVPNAQLPSAEELGVPSLEAGHALPAGAVFVGEGETAQGVIVPVNLSTIGALLPSGSPPWFWAIGGALVVALAWYISDRSRR
jgi:hypothetical protein